MSGKRFLLTGATGLVGSTLVEKQPEQFIGLARTTVPWFPPKTPFIACDIFSGPPYPIPWEELAGIVFLAFPTQVTEVEKYSASQQTAFLKNFQTFTEKSATKGMPVLFFSSDAVLWDAPRTERRANDTCKPTTVYGKLKAACETIVSKSLIPGNLILRATPVGFHRYATKHGFLGKLVSLMLENKAVEGYAQSMITPVSIDSVGKFIFEWMANPEGFVKERGSLIHVTSSRPVSKYDLLKFCAKNQNTEHLLTEKVRPLDQTLIPSQGCEVSIEETESSLLRSLQLLGKVVRHP